MQTHRAKPLRAFTLVELMVTISIIALLVAILLPAAQAVRNGAKKAASLATYNAINAGIESFRSEQRVGGAYPPSASDNPDNYGLIDDPFAGLASGAPIKANGAHLLGMALQGADYLGTAGFRDLDGDGLWWNDTDDAYRVTNGVAEQPRYGPYAGSDLQENSRTFAQMDESGELQSTMDGAVADAQDLPFYADGFGRPILFYRARPAASLMVTDPGNAIGIFDQRDNDIFTGSNVGGALGGGIDLGGGAAHKIAETKFPGADPKTNDIASANYDDTFERFIWNPAVTARNTPYRADSYLLISAGLDGIYGNNDDIINWSKNE